MTTQDRHQRKEVFPMQREDLERIRKYFYQKDKIVILALINVGVNVALRYSDLSKLRFEDIKTDASISILEQKTGKRRDFKFNEVCLKEVKRLQSFYLSMNITPTGYLFKSLRRCYIKQKEDRFLSLRSFNRYLKEAEQALCLNYSIGSHSLRKTWGYFYYKENKDIAMVMRVLNHSSAETTLRYLGFQREQIYQVYENFTI